MDANHISERLSSMRLEISDLRVTTARYWSKSQPTLSQAANDPTRIKYENHLKNTGCPLKASDRNPNTGWWGTNSQKISSDLVGKNVQAGDVIGWAGSTGPGGQAANHLHIFFAHRDPSDKRWYFFDPYGIYPNLPHQWDCFGRTYFARSPNSEVWVSFDDLPKATREVLWQRHKQGLAFPAGLEDIPF